MANQRPINRRPWRRPPWKGARKRRPARWLDANSAATSPSTECVAVGIAVGCEPATPHELLYGDLDFDWSDRTEVTVDRLVGSIDSFIASSSAPSGAGFLASPVLLRFGLLALEDNDRIYPTIDLFDRENLEEFEWMWLHQEILGEGVNQGSVPEATGLVQGFSHLPIDLRNRRKLGKRDGLALYSQWNWVFSNPDPDSTQVLAFPQLRAIVMS